MLFRPGRLDGVYSIEMERKIDDRGFFARTFCEREFEQHNLVSRYVQCNLSYNKVRGTLRGMHLQRDPKPEIKLVRCVRGVAFDVVLDLRPGSNTYCEWQAFEISDANGIAIYIPAGVAHGFQALADDTELFYHMSEFYEPSLAAGVRWNDSCFGIAWPLANPTLSERDAAFADFNPALGIQ
jgi:dTDP-4-dehydrorhamnose 3,5-epimerase